ncbi:MAG: helix-turn-helix transcriptional regulator, partial [Fimbriimonadaceae bacterium]
MSEKGHTQFGETVRRIRRRLGMTQLELAERSGLHLTYISGIERGTRNPTLSVLERLAAGL